jgi:hypothetical protein
VTSTCSRKRLQTGFHRISRPLDEGNICAGNSVQQSNAFQIKHSEPHGFFAELQTVQMPVHCDRQRFAQFFAALRGFAADFARP